MIKDLASQIIAQLAQNLSNQIESSQRETGREADEANTESSKAEESISVAAAPAQVGGMAFRVLWNQFIRSLKKIFGFKH